MGFDASRWVVAREVAAAAVIVGVGIGWRVMTGSLEADATPPQAAAPAHPGGKPVAIVNGVEITADQLATDCLGRHGGSVLETLVNRRIIEQACQQQRISVTPQDVSAEIDAMARRFSVPRDKWLEMIQQERGITPKQYADDIVWPMLALRGIARGAVEPSAEELQQAFENRFGSAVKARIIACRSRQDADAVRKQALAAPEEFGALARQHSVDVGSASANGWVQPIRLHSGDPAFDKAAFSLQEGGISEVVQVADQFIVIKCEGHLPPSGAKLDEVRPHLAEELRERKSRQASSEIFKKLQDATSVENVMNDPAKAAARPGVAALVNGQPVLIEDVKSVCLDRYGRDVIEVLVTRTLVEQALKKQQQSVVQADLDGEIARAAAQMGFTKADGTADTAAWLDRVTRAEKVPMRHYMEDVVWPTVALKKLVGSVSVSQEDLDKAFQATFGPRAKCRVVVLDSQRRAQEVWQMARQNPTAEHIATLAETYSADPTTRSTLGRGPGGRPLHGDLLRGLHRGREGVLCRGSERTLRRYLREEAADRDGPPLHAPAGVGHDRQLCRRHEPVAHAGGPGWRHRRHRHAGDDAVQDRGGRSGQAPRRQREGGAGRRARGPSGTSPEVILVTRDPHAFARNRSRPATCSAPAGMRSPTHLRCVRSLLDRFGTPL